MVYECFGLAKLKATVTLRPRNVSQSDFHVRGYRAPLPPNPAGRAVIIRERVSSRFSASQGPVDPGGRNKLTSVARFTENGRVTKFTLSPFPFPSSLWGGGAFVVVLLSFPCSRTNAYIFYTRLPVPENFPPPISPAVMERLRT